MDENNQLNNFTKTMYRTALILIVVFLFVPGQSAAANKKIAVVEFEASGFKGSDARAMTRRFSGKIMSSNKYELIGREMVKNQYLQFKNQSGGECSGLSCLVRLGNSLEADYIVFGELNKVGSSYSLSYQLINVKTKKSIFSKMKDCESCKIEDVFLGTMNESAKDVVTALNNLENAAPPSYASGRNYSTPGGKTADQYREEARLRREETAKRARERRDRLKQEKRDAQDEHDAQKKSDRDKKDRESADRESQVKEAAAKLKEAKRLAKEEEKQKAQAEKNRQKVLKKLKKHFANLASENDKKRKKAEDAIRSAGKEAIPGLIENVKGTYPFLVNKCAEILADMGARESIPALREALYNYGDPDILVKALQQLGGREAKEVIAEYERRK